MRQEQTPDGKRVVVGTTPENYNDPAYWGATRSEYYLDPMNEYMLVGYRQMLPDGTVMVEAKIERAPNTEGVLVPTAVTIDIREEIGGEIVLKHHKEMTVDEMILNAPIPLETFEFEFPPGTTVKDHVAGATYTVGG